MAGEWRKVILNEITESINTGLDAIRRAPIVNYQTDIKCLRIQDISQNKPFRLWGDTEVKQSDFDKYRLIKDDIIMARTCSTGINLLIKDDLNGVFNNGLARLRLKKQLAYPQYIYYVFRSRPFIDYINGISGGTSVQLNMQVGDLSRFELNLPPLPEQRAIAHILGTLDEKIELNRRMSETLEAIVRAIFKSWFLDFGPVRAKIESLNLSLPKNIVDLFPDSFEDSELGEIPAGWKVRHIGDILELAYGRALKEEARRSGEIPVFGSNGQVGWHDQRLSAGPGIIVGRKGNPGTVTWSPTDFFAIDTTFYVIPKGNCRSLYFLFHALINQDLPSLTADSAVPGLNRNLAYMNKQVVPGGPVLDRFDEQVRPLFQRMHENQKESQALVDLRDTLLPKLISGELRVPDAEQIVGSQI
jgi:type I restriction enzyme, S subunit